MDIYSSTDIGHVSFSGLNEPCSIGSIVEVVINAHGDSSNGSVIVEAIPPSGRLKKCQVVKKSNIFTATFTPNEIGEWRIGILYNNEHIRGSPFSCKVYDANLVQVYGLDVGLVGQELKFSVNASQAGEGRVKVSVLRHGRLLPCDVLEQGNSGLYRVSFTPDGAGQYKIHVLFNEMEVKGSPFILDIADASSLSVYGDNLRMASVDRLSTFTIHAVGADPKDITVTITAPSGKTKLARIYQTDDVTYKVEWKAVETGEHSIDVCLFNQSIYESPFLCNVGDPDLVSVRNIPDFIDADQLFKDYTFEIDASAAGSGNLEIMINGGRVPCRVRELGGRSYLASFTPTQAVPHVIEMRFNGENVRLSPWMIHVKNQQPEIRYEIEHHVKRKVESKSTERKESWYIELSGVGLQRAAVGKLTSFEIFGDSIEKDDIQIKFWDPYGKEVPVKIRRSENKFVCEYKIDKVGEHRLEMLICGKKTEPYPLFISGYSLDNVKIEPLGGGLPGQAVQFFVDAVEAGKGQLEISVNQGRVPNNVQMQGAGRCLVTFIPQYPGKYVIDVTFNGEQVQGCPIQVDILPKQVGKSVSTPIVSQQTTTIMPPVHDSGAVLRPPEGRTSSPASPSLVQHVRQRSREPVPSDHPRSPILVRKVDQRSEIKTHTYSSTWDEGISPGSRSLSQQAAISPHHPSPSDTIDRSRRSDDKDRDVIFDGDKDDSRLGYTVAKYGNGSGERTGRTITSRSFADDGRGTITSTVTSETRYGTISPSRTYEYTKGTVSSLADGVHEKTPTAYSEMHLYEPSKPTYTIADKESYGSQPFISSIPPNVLRKDPDLPEVRLAPQKKPSLQTLGDPKRPRIESTDFVTDSRSYGIQKERTDSYGYFTQNDRDKKTGKEPSHCFDDSLKKDIRKFVASDVGKITTSYEPHDSSIHRQSSADQFDSLGSLSTNYSKSTFDPSKIHSNGQLRKSDNLKDSAYSTSSYDDYKHVKDKDPHMIQSEPISKLGISEEIKPTTKNWQFSDGYQPDHHDKKPDEQFSNKFSPDYKNQKRTDYGSYDRITDERMRKFENEKESVLSRSKEMEPSSMSTLSQRVADTMRIQGDENRIYDLHGRVKSPTDKSSFEFNESEGNISSNVVEEALTPILNRKPYHRLQKEEDLDETLETMADGQREENLFEKDEELMHSKPTSTSTTPKSTPKTTPKLNLKFAKQAQEGKVFDFGKSKFTSKHEVVRKGKDVDVKLESLKLAKEDQLRFVILPPNKANLEQLEIEPKIKKSRHNYEISFRPTEVGTHKVMVYVNDVLHPQCPFPIRVYDASEIIVGEIVPQSTINDTVEFTVDAGRAGFGNLEMAIKDSDGVIIPSHVAQLESGTAKFLVTFNPTSVGMHTVNITFNKEVLKNSPFEVNIVEAKPIVTDSGIIDDKKKEKKQKEERKREEKEKQKKEREEKQLAETLKKNREKELKKKKHILDRKPSLSKIPSLSRVNKSAQIVVSVYDDSPLEVSVKDPSKNLIDYSISDHESGGKKVEFIPVKVGDHEVDIKCGGIDVQGSPFTCRAYDPAKIGVGNIPNGIVEQAVHFIVDASEAGVGNLEVAVNEGRVPSMAQSLGQHRYDISFIPREKVDHTISVRFNNEPVPGSPFICHLVSTHSISASGPGLERVPVGQTSEFFVLIEGDQSDIPSVRITDSQGNNIPVRVDKDNAADSRFIINYTPQIVGNHQIEIEHAGKPVHGSPFTSKAFDAKCARLSRVDAAYVGRPCTFTIDAARAGAGNMEIIVSVDNRNVPNFVQAEGQAKFKVSFTPQEAKDHVISVRFNGEPIPGSPMVCPVSEVSQSVAAVVPLSSGPDIAQQARLVGDISSAQVGNVKGFTVDTGGRDADCNVIVIDPIGNEVCVQMERVSTGYLAQFVPQTAGTYGVRIEIDGKEMNSSPFVIEVTGQPKISRIPSVVFIGKEMAFNAETDLANRRNINIEIRGEDGRTIPVRTSVDNTGIKASCKFRNVGRYSVNITLNGKLIESKTIEVVEPGVGVSLVNDIDQGFVGQAYKVLLRIDNNSLKKLVAVAVTDQERNPVSVSLKKISDDIFEAEFTPLFEGTHKIAVTIDERHIRGSPFTVTILDLSAVRIIGLKNDAVGVEQRFNVDWSNSGGSEASVRVTKDNSEVPCTVKKIKQGLHVCSFTPKQVGLYLIDVYVDGTLLPECPYECIVNDMGAVRARGDALTRAQRGKIARFEVSVGNNTRRELDVLVRDSHGSPLPVRCYKQHDDSYWVEFTPENIGSHKIEVTFGDVPIAGSPFHCEVVDPRKVFIRGNTEPLILRQQAVLTVERENAGNGELKVEIVDPTGQPLKIEKTKSPNGEERIIFLPTRLGQHKLTAKLSGFVVNGSPQMLVVEEQGEPSLYGDALNRPAEVEQPVILIFDSKKQKGALKVDIRGPDRSKARFATNKRSDGNVEIIFNPSEVGQYMVNAEMNNKPIAGSPFDVSVVDARKVLINDELADDKGTFHFPIQQNNIIDVDATAAGPGKLRAEVRDGSGKVMDAAEVESLGYGKYRIIFNPQIAGKFNIYLYWADIAVESAFPIHIIAETEQPSTSRVMPLSDEIDHRSRSRSSERYEDGQDDHQRIIARGDGLTKAIVKEQSEFIIDGSDSNQDGHISCSLIGQKADVPVRLIHLGNNVYKASYTPLISGKYELQIMWNGRQIRGSPFKVNVDSHTSAAELINVDTSTLKFGVINEDIKTVINTRKAPPGQLSAQCMGPSKLAYCELYDHRDGTYTLSVKPSEIGKHTLVIKYSDEHVPGSPFIVNVSHAPDASKVRVYGPGIEHGILSTFKSNFVVETKGAGAGQLTVRVRGPKGAFNVEMQREKKQERTIHCKYEPKEPGDYQVEVKWHGEHVPGSPFLVMIVDTEQELQRFLRGDAPSPQPATPFIPPGWVGTPPPPPPLFLSGAGIRPPFPHHPSFSPPHPHHGPILPYAPLPPPPMRAGVRPKYASGY